MRSEFYILFFISLLGFSYSQCQGDANLDDVVNIQDVIITVNHILGDIELDGNAFDNADADHNGQIDVLDVVIIVEIVLNNDEPCDDSNPIDLSLEWEFQEDLSYFDFEELEDIMSTEVADLENILGMIVIHQGKIVSEQYYNGSFMNQDYNIWSVTKSYTSTLIGQAIDQGLINGTDYTLDSFLPEFDQPYLQYVQLNDLLSMSSGYWDNYFYPEWVHVPTSYLVNMTNMGGPGLFFYNNSACHLHSHILYYGTGITPMEFANINLFPYLGIETPGWLEGYNNINDGSASLILRLREMVKLGQLYLQDGYSGDVQILSSEWIREATSFKVSTNINWNDLDGYGYLWWLPERGYLAFGYGGQFIAVIPELELIIGVHSLVDNVPDETDYQTLLLECMYDRIAPLFEEID